jgi:hypothetical protein
VVDYSRKRLTEARPETAVALAEPHLVDSPYPSATEPYLEIIDRESGNRVVTIVEFLSPSNKSPGANRDEYVRKQREICESNTNLVEIDLNRFGTHTLAVQIDLIRPEWLTGYMTCIRRAVRRDKSEIYPMPIWQRLPVIKVPLRPEDADVPLDLQALVEQCYQNGGYVGTLDYSLDPEPPLLGAEKEWADEWLQKKGLRKVKKAARSKGKKK